MANGPTGLLSNWCVENVETRIIGFLVATRCVALSPILCATSLRSSYL